VLRRDHKMWHKQANGGEPQTLRLQREEIHIRGWDYCLSRSLDEEDRPRCDAHDNIYWSCRIKMNVMHRGKDARNENVLTLAVIL